MIYLYYIPEKAFSNIKCVLWVLSVCNYYFSFHLKTTTSPKPPMAVPQLQVQQPIAGGQQQGFIGKKFNNISKYEKIVITECFNFFNDNVYNIPFEVRK